MIVVIAAVVVVGVLRAGALLCTGAAIGACAEVLRIAPECVEVLAIAPECVEVLAIAPSAAGGLLTKAVAAAKGAVCSNEDDDMSGDVSLNVFELAATVFEFATPTPFGDGFRY